MKKIVLITILSMVLAQSALAARNFISPPSLIDTNNEKTKMVKEGGATMRGDNQKTYQMPDLFEKKKIVVKPREQSVKQQVWEEYSYPVPRFVTD